VEYARARQTWERLYEATQLKGDGETHPLLSPEDEFADFQTWDFGNLDLSGAKTPEMLPGEYARSGLLRGLQLEAELGVNPFKFGLQAGTDTHTALSTVDEDNFFSTFTTYEPSAERATHPAKSNQALGIEGYAGWQYSAAGITVVSAPENTRGAIFDAMERREVYATTGPRMRARLRHCDPRNCPRRREAGGSRPTALGRWRCTDHRARGRVRGVTATSDAADDNQRRETPRSRLAAAQALRAGATPRSRAARRATTASSGSACSTSGHSTPAGARRSSSGSPGACRSC
jgi:Protein of unknown function (DUF3604)